MDSELPEDILYQGMSVDIVFADPRPSFGDLFRICGDTHPQFPPTGAFGFERLTEPQFDQVDDYFGVRSLAEVGRCTWTVNSVFAPSGVASKSSLRVNLGTPGIGI